MASSRSTSHVLAEPDVHRGPSANRLARSTCRRSIASIGIERDYSGLDLDGFDVDLQGWASGHPIFDRLLRDVRPSVVIELGTWKGASLLRMHGIARELELTTAFVSVDTWLGSSEHWLERRDSFVTSDRRRLPEPVPPVHRQRARARCCRGRLPAPVADSCCRRRAGSAGRHGRSDLHRCITRGAGTSHAISSCTSNSCVQAGSCSATTITPAGQAS